MLKSTIQKLFQTGRPIPPRKKGWWATNLPTESAGEMEQHQEGSYLEIDCMPNRPTTATNKKHNFNAKPTSGVQKDNFNKTLNYKRTNEEKLASKKYLRKQKSTEGDLEKSLTSKSTPNTVKRKAEKITIDADKDLGGYENDDSHTTGEKSAKKHRFVHDEESTPTSISSHVQGRSTVTP